MKNVLFSFFVLFCSAINASGSHATSDDELRISPTFLLETSTSFATTISTLQDNLDDMFTSDILSPDIDASDRVGKKIISAFTEFSSNCNMYKRIELSLKNFTFPKKSINVNVGIGNVSFHNITAEDCCIRTVVFSTSVRCDSSGKAKIEVTLPRYIKISANIKITEINDSPNGLVSQLTNEGVIFMYLNNNSISKQFSFQTTNSSDEDNILREISYSSTEVYINKMDTKHQKLIYNNLGKVLDEMESSLEQFFVNQLNAILSKNKIAVDRSCSKFINVENNQRKINLSFLHNDFNNLYVVPNVTLESWKGVSLSTGTALIEGISHFNSIEASVSATDLSRPSYDEFFYSTPLHPEKKEMTFRLKTNALKDRHYLFVRSEENTMHIDLSLGNLHFKSPDVCENGNEFMNFVLSYYLKKIVKDSLKTSLAEKLQNDSAVGNC